MFVCMDAIIGSRTHQEVVFRTREWDLFGVPWQIEVAHAASLRCGWFTPPRGLGGVARLQALTKRRELGETRKDGSDVT